MKDERDLIRNQPCINCNHPPPSDPAHIKTRGSGAGFKENEMMPLCRVCHVEQHTVGILHFCTKNTNVMRHINEKGWEFINIGQGIKKLRRK